MTTLDEPEISEGYCLSLPCIEFKNKDDQNDCLGMCICILLILIAVCPFGLFGLMATNNTKAYCQNIEGYNVQYHRIYTDYKTEYQCVYTNHTNGNQTFTTTYDNFQKVPWNHKYIDPIVITVSCICGSVWIFILICLIYFISVACFTKILPFGNALFFSIFTIALLPVVSILLFLIGIISLPIIAVIISFGLILLPFILGYILFVPVFCILIFDYSYDHTDKISMDETVKLQVNTTENKQQSSYLKMILSPTKQNIRDLLSGSIWMSFMIISVCLVLLIMMFAVISTSPKINCKYESGMRIKYTADYDTSRYLCQYTNKTNPANTYTKQYNMYYGKSVPLNKHYIMNKFINIEVPILSVLVFFTMYLFLTIMCWIKLNQNITWYKMIGIGCMIGVLIISILISIIPIGFLIMVNIPILLILLLISCPFVIIGCIIYKLRQTFRINQRQKLCLLHAQG